MKKDEAQGAAPQHCGHEKRLIGAMGKCLACACEQMAGEIQDLRAARVEAGAQPPQDARKEFEKWFIAKYGFKPTAVDEVAWEAWLAARSTPSPDPPEEVPRNYVDSKHLENEGRGESVEWEPNKAVRADTRTSAPPLSNERPSELLADSPPQIVSAPTSKDLVEAHAILALVQNVQQRRLEYFASLKDDIAQRLSEYASSSNAALEQERDHFAKQNLEWANCSDRHATENAGLRKRIHHLENHNQYFFRCESAWCNPAEDYNPALEMVKGAVERAEAAESKVKDAANEIHMLERAAESHKYTVADLVAERDGLREALRKYGTIIG